MIRNLFIVALISIGALLIRRLWRTRKEQLRHQATNAQQKMLRCAHCSLHFPENEAVHQGEQVFCCQQHAEQAQPSHH